MVPGLASGLMGLGGQFVSTISQGVMKYIDRMKQEKTMRFQAKAQIPGVVNAIKTINSMVEQNKIDEETALASIDRIFGQASSELKNAYQTAMKEGMASIQENAQRSLDAVSFQLNEAKKDADYNTQKEIERAEKVVNEIAKEVRTNLKGAQDQLSRRGLAGSGAMLSVVKKTQLQLGDTIAKINEQSGNVLEGIARQLSGTERAGIFQRRQISSEAGSRSRELASALGTQQAQQMAGLSLQRGSQEEEARRYYGGIEQELTQEKSALDTALSGLTGQAFFSTKGNDMLSDTFKGDPGEALYSGLSQALNVET